MIEELDDELDQYHVEASYRYVWKDRACFGKSVSLMESPDNDGEFHKKLISDLEEHGCRLAFRCNREVTMEYGAIQDVAERCAKRWSWRVAER